MRTRLLLAVLIPLVAFSGCAMCTLATQERSHPVVDGQLEVAGLGHPIVVLRDAHGVPHIRAEDEAGAWYGLGFVHAQDRLFQADLNRRVAWGGLAEWLGDDWVELDGFMRGLALRKRAAAALRAADHHVRAGMEAYAAGFNAGAASLSALPVEYRLLEVGFEPWRPEDGLAASFLNSWFLQENHLTEVTALVLRARMDRALAEELLATDPDGPPLDDHWEALRAVELADFTPGYRAFADRLGIGGDPQASNNWAVGPSRSADGAPIVANDPHLIQSVPSVWYLADLKGGELHVAGATFPGTPAVPTGHNARVAWGVTNVMADYVDLAVLERRDDGYVLDGATRAFDIRRVEIPVAGGAPAVRELPFTDLGPVITGLDAPHVVALRWTALELLDRSADGFHRLAHAGTMGEALEAARTPAVVAQNFVVGDVDGHIGWTVGGAIPLRKAHTGRIPYLASRTGQGWSGYLKELPGEVDPARGFLNTANARPDHPRADAISTRFIPPWRHDRIAELLSRQDALTPEDMLRIQQDRLDTRARARLPSLLEGWAPTSDAAARCAGLLRDWDHEADVDSVGATVWAGFQRALLEEALEPRLGAEGLRRYLPLTALDQSPVDGPLERHLDDPDAALERALTRTCERLEARLGSDPDAWRWGRVHALSLRHPFAEARRLLDGWNMETIEWGGSPSTVNQAGYDRVGDDWKSTWIASLRIVTPLSDPGAATAVYPGGQSGQPGHEHYRSHFEAWKEGRTLPLWFDDDDVAAHARDTLVLTPAD